MLNETIQGNVIVLYIPLEDTESEYVYTVPDGYSFKTIYLIGSNIIFANPSNFNIGGGYAPWGRYTFPIVNGKSPVHFSVKRPNIEKDSYLYIFIEEFGLEPDYEYFAHRFSPIKCVNANGQEYNAIPSTQFK